ncbi:hypothetical protein THERMOT_523 [Bathymodiolus thermophilus thioautotrophic gill symbiont]|nr:hypothetical protein THERMOT_523 [Bathymodiolus thermophilus thioautotrophic gill symbiont]
MNQNQVVEQVSRHSDLYTLQHVVEFVIHAFFLDEKVLMLPVFYEKYNSLLSMNIKGGTCKVRNEIETKSNETKFFQNEM